MKKLIVSGLVVVLAAVIGAVWWANRAAEPQTGERQYVQIAGSGSSASDLPVFESALPTLTTVPGVLRVLHVQSQEAITIGDQVLWLAPWQEGLEPPLSQQAPDWSGASVQDNGGSGLADNEIVLPDQVGDLAWGGQFVGTEIDVEYTEMIRPHEGQGAQAAFQVVGTYQPIEGGAYSTPWGEPVALVSLATFKAIHAAMAVPVGDPAGGVVPDDYQWRNVVLEVSPGAQDAVLARLAALGYSAAEWTP